jgi:hypothetical protein
MRRLYLAFALLSALLLGVPAHATHAAPAAAGIPGGTGMPLALRTDGAYVAWVELAQPNRFTRYANIHVASLADGQSILELNQLAFWNYGGPWGPSFDMDNGVLVWRDGVDGQNSFPLKALDLRSGESWVLSANGGAYPNIGYDQVSWWEITNRADGTATAALMQRPLRGEAAATEVHRITLAHDYDLRGARMNLDWAVWAQASARPGGEFGCPLIYALSLRDTTRYETIGNIECFDSQQVQFDLDGNQLAYLDGYHVLVTRDLLLGQEQRSGPHANADIALAGRYVFWNHVAAPGVFGFDAQTGSTFQVSAADEVVAPAAGGGWLAWTERASAGGYVVRAQPIGKLLPGAARNATETVSGQLFFPETSHTLGGEFRNYWQRNGGLPVFGYPLTQEFQQRSADTGADYVVQYFERQRYELHPENSGTPYVVQLGRLGAEALAERGTDWQALPKSDPATPHYFPATGQAIAPEFWEYWRAHGLDLGDRGLSEREALALWGYPLTPPSYEMLPMGETLLVQWFERARFEYHPNNPAPYRVLLGRLAADKMSAFGW